MLGFPGSCSVHVCAKGGQMEYWSPGCPRGVLPTADGSLGSGDALGTVGFHVSGPVLGHHLPCLLEVFEEGAFLQTLQERPPTLPSQADFSGSRRFGWHWVWEGLRASALGGWLFPGSSS